MTGNTPIALPRLDGAIALVTGATSGIGLRIAARLASAGAELIIPARDPARGRTAAENIREAVPGAKVNAPVLDLASRRSIDSFTDELLRSRAHVNLLINNAGIMTPPQRLSTVDGFELQFGVNHLGHFVLTTRLLPLLRAGRAHVVTQTSVAASRGAMNWNDLQWERKYSPNAAYGQSKVAAGAFGLELQRRSEAGEWGISSDVAHPGIAPTGLLGARPELGRDKEPGLGRLVRVLSQRGILFGDIDSAADPALLAAVTPGGGRLFGPSGLGHLRGPAAEQKPFATIASADTGKRLWAASEDLTSVTV